MSQTLLKIRRRLKGLSQRLTGAGAPVNDKNPDLNHIDDTAQITGTAHLGGGCVIGARARIRHGLTLGYASTIGPECWIRGPVEIGRYCQLAPRVCLQAANHPIGTITPYNNVNLCGGVLKKLTTSRGIKLGHGVWIGYGALVLDGINVGNGAIIGAGAIVTKDVAPYSIVAGNPARVLRERFSSRIVELIEASEWWTREFDELEGFADVFLTDLTVDEEQAEALLLSFRERLGSMGQLTGAQT